MTDSTLEERELEDIVERAHDELDDQEFAEALHHAVEEGERAGRREARHWLLGLLVGVVVVASIIGDGWFALIIPLLLVLYALPIIVAGMVTAEREEEKDQLIEAIHEHERHPTEHEAQDSRSDPTP